MRTTLKRGIGRAAEVNGNGRATYPPGPPSPVTLYRQPLPAARSRRSVVLRIARLGGARAARLPRGRRGRRLPLRATSPLPPLAPESRAEREAAETARHRDGRPARHGARDRLRPARRRGGGTPSRSDTLMLLRADPRGKTISLLSFPRDMTVADPLPRADAVHREDQHRVHVLRAPRDARHGPRADRAADQLHHHRQLPWLPPARRQGGRRLDGRRPPLLQRPQRRRPGTRRSTFTPATSS